jgi:hypothetical protein
MKDLFLFPVGTHTHFCRAYLNQEKEDQPYCNTCGSSKTTVNLERCMTAKKIGIRSAAVHIKSLFRS